MLVKPSRLRFNFIIQDAVIIKMPDIAHSMHYIAQELYFQDSRIDESLIRSSYSMNYHRLLLQQNKSMTKRRSANIRRSTLHLNKKSFLKLIIEVYSQFSRNFDSRTIYQYLKEYYTTLWEENITKNEIIKHLSMYNNHVNYTMWVDPRWNNFFKNRFALYLDWKMDLKIYHDFEYLDDIFNAQKQKEYNNDSVKMILHEEHINYVISMRDTPVVYSNPLVRSIEVGTKNPYVSDLLHQYNLNLIDYQYNMKALTLLYSRILKFEVIEVEDQEELLKLIKIITSVLKRDNMF